LNTALPISSINGALSGNGISFLTASSSTGLIDFVSSDKGCLPVVLGDSTSNSASLSTLAQTSSKTLQLVYASVAIANGEPGTCTLQTNSGGYVASSFTDSHTCTSPSSGGTGCATFCTTSGSGTCTVNTGSCSATYTAPTYTTSPSTATCRVSFIPATYVSSSKATSTCFYASTLSCTNTQMNSNRLPLNVANDLHSVAALFCVQNGVCCVTASGASTPCNADPVAATVVKSSATQLKIDLSLILILFSAASL